MKINSLSINNNSSKIQIPNKKYQKEIYTKPVNVVNYQGIDMKMANAMFASVSFKSKLTRNADEIEKMYKNKDLGLSEYKQKMFYKLLSLRDENGNLVIDPETEYNFIKNDSILNEEMAKRIIDRNLINSKDKDSRLLVVLSIIDDKKWELLKNYNYIDIVKKCPKPFLLYSADLIDINNFLDIYSKKLFVDKFGDNATVVLYDKLCGSDVNASNTGMLADLILKNKLPVNLISAIPPKGKLSDNVSSDIEKLYVAQINNENINDTFIDEYEDEATAKRNTKVGDIFTLKNEKNIRIKDKDEEIKEIFLSKEKYLKLFPPVERYAYIQGHIGHCFILTSLDVMYSNPESRYNLLKVFRENPDNTVSIDLNGFRKEGDKVIPFNENDYVTDDVENIELNNDTDYSYTSEGIKCIEKFLELDAVNNAKKNIKEYNEKIKKALKEIGNNDFIEMDGFEYSKEELEIIAKNLKDFYENPEDISKTMVSMSDVYFKLRIKLDIPEDSILCSNQSIYYSSSDGTIKKDKKIEECIKLLNLMWRRYKKKYGDKDYVYIQEVIPIKLIDYLTGNLNRDKMLMYTESGAASGVFKKFNMDSEDIHFFDDESAVENLLTSSNKLNNNLITISSKYNFPPTDEHDMIPNHYYSFNIDDGEKGRKFKIRNPYNTAWEDYIDINEIMNYFNMITIANTKENPVN